MTQGSSLIIVAGALAKDPEMRFTPSGQAVTAFSIPVNRQWSNTNGDIVKETTWHRIAVWGKAAEACNKYLKKGSIVFVTGKLSPDKNTGGPKVFTRQDGSSGASFDITAEHVQFLWTANNGDQGEVNTSTDQPAEDDIPF